MIVVLHHNPMNNQVAFFIEPPSPEAAAAAAQLMAHMSEKITNDLAAQQAANGQEAQRPSGLILPPVRIPKDMKGGVNNNA